jgi:hypothetical protein
MRFQKYKNLRNIILALLVSRLFFELNHYPKYGLELYEYIGHIRCRINSHVFIKILRVLYLAYLEFIINGKTLLVSLSNSDICKLCHRYRRIIKFHVRRLNDPIKLLLRFSPNNKRKFNDFPHSIK